MSLSGVAADPKCSEVLKGLVKTRTYQCVIYKMNEDMTLVQVEKTIPVADGGSPQDHWDGFAKCLPDDDCRYVVYDFNFEHQGAMKNRIIFLLWSPNAAKIRSKMVYASSRESFANKLEGVQRLLQCTDRDDIKYTDISQALAKHTAGY